jgi:Sodium:neurotransmitter symporter family
VLGMSDGIDNIGTPRWQLVVSLLVAWIFIFLALFKGVKTSGKVCSFKEF